MYRILECVFYCVLIVTIFLLFLMVDSENTYHTENYQNSVVMVTNNQGKGTGYHIGNGYIITAAHVVSNPSDYSIKTQNDDTFAVEIIASFEEYDVAILKVDTIPAYLSSARMTCQEPVVGEELHSIGNPQNLEFAHTWGRVSFPRIDDLFDKFKRVFVLDMTVVPGQSGAPLFNENGKVEGMISAVMVHPFRGRFPNIVGYGYAIPANVICDLAGEYYER